MHMPRVIIASTLLFIALSGCTPYHLYQGNQEFSRGDFAAAEREYLAAHGSDEATLNRAAIRIRQGRLAEAVPLLEPLAKRSADFYVDMTSLSVTSPQAQARMKLSYVCSELSAAQIRAHRYGDAMDLAQKALDANPANLYAKTNLAISAGKRGVVPLALALYREVIATAAAAELQTDDGVSLRAVAEAGLADLPAPPPVATR